MFRASWLQSGFFQDLRRGEAGMRARLLTEDSVFQQLSMDLSRARAAERAHLEKVDPGLLELNAQIKEGR